MSCATALVGGVGYAATSLQSVVNVAAHVATPPPAISVTGISPGKDQYKPGYGKGDKNHVHKGPPGLTKKQAQTTTGAAGVRTVAAEVAVDEQATLTVTVRDAKGALVPLGVAGGQATSIVYDVLVPRALPIQLQIPKGLLKAGQPYSLHVVAVDWDGETSSVDVSFVG